MALYLEGVGDGWDPVEGSCSAESKEMLACMSWVGRRSAVKLNERIRSQLDWLFLLCLATGKNPKGAPHFSNSCVSYFLVQYILYIVNFAFVCGKQPP